MFQHDLWWYYKVAKRKSHLSCSCSVFSRNLSAVGSTIFQDLKWASNIDKMIKRPNRGCLSCVSSGSSICLRHCWSKCTLQYLSLFFAHQSSNGQLGLQKKKKKKIGADFLSIQDFKTNSESDKHHTLDTTGSNSSPLIGITEHCTPKQPICYKYLCTLFIHIICCHIPI